MISNAKHKNPGTIAIITKLPNPKSIKPKKMVGANVPISFKIPIHKLWPLSSFVLKANATKQTLIIMLSKNAETMAASLSEN
jgi:hypothetical protein